MSAPQQSPEIAPLTDDERFAIWSAGDHAPELCDCAGSDWSPEGEWCGGAEDTFAAVERIIAARLAPVEALAPETARRRVDVSDIEVGQVWRSRDRRDVGRVVTVEEWDGDRYGFVVVRSVRRSRIRALNFVRQYDLRTPPGQAGA